MNNFKNLLIAITVLFAISSCSDDDESVFEQPEEPGSEFDARLNTAFPDSTSATVFLSDIDDNKIDVFMSFSSNEPMKRFYSTVNVQNQGEETFAIGQLTGAEDKADGSLELDPDQKEAFSINLDLTTTSLSSGEGTVVYKFWTTTGKGDFRDDEKRQATAPLILTVNLGGTNPATPLVSSEDIRLFAPTADLMSESFVSSVDGEIYALDEFEFSDLWDIGYSAQSNNPQLSSAFGSPQRFFYPEGSNTIVSFQELIAAQLGDSAAADLNMAYFVDIDDSFDFDGATSVGDLSALSVSSSNPQTIDIPTDADGDIIAFIDQYGNKGVIRIDALVDANNDGDYFNNVDYVQIDIKVQQ